MEIHHMNYGCSSDKHQHLWEMTTGVGASEEENGVGGGGGGHKVGPGGGRRVMAGRSCNKLLHLVIYQVMLEICLEAMTRCGPFSAISPSKLQQQKHQQHQQQCGWWLGKDESFFSLCRRSSGVCSDKLVAALYQFPFSAFCQAESPCGALKLQRQVAAQKWRTRREHSSGVDLNE